MKVLFLLTCLVSIFSVQVFSQTETGIASYYSDQLHGKLTASGEVYDKSKLTAAHRTLPFGTLVRITRIDNGKSVQVRINDRGPFTAARIIDISRKAAEKLALIQAGTAKVKVEVIKKTKSPGNVAIEESHSGLKESNSTEGVMKQSGNTSSAQTIKSPALKASSTFEASAMNQPSNDLFQIQMLPQQSHGFGVQMGSFGDFDNALKKAASLQKDWLRNILVKRSEDGNGNEILKIILGPFPSRESAGIYLSELKEKGMAGFIVNLQELK